MSVPETIHVTTASRAYDVVVGEGLFEGLGTRVRKACNPDQAFVVTDSNVGPLYLPNVVAALEAAGLPVCSHTVPAGEQHKTFATFGGILEAMAHAGLTRDSVVVALGGGVVGDMAGFAAATYMRGVQVVQVPTTLLAMVDSSVGGKTAIDLPAGKNLVGAFLQPSLVVADVSCLATLTADVFIDGIGEIVKHAVLADETLFDCLSAEPLSQGSDRAYLAQVVARNVQIKRDVVATDEREKGLRQTLNLGHTIGHAVEAASDFRLGHGHCVAIGLCSVARASEALRWADRGLADRIEACTSAQGLPIDTDLSHDTIVAFATHDKKRHANSVNLVVPRRIGSCEIMPVSLERFSHIVNLGCGVRP
jgi:3-dehydroquinate synthase